MAIEFVCGSIEDICFIVPRRDIDTSEVERGTNRLPVGDAYAHRQQADGYRDLGYHLKLF
jgi:hypothetical protein